MIGPDLTIKTNTQLDYSKPLDVHKWSDYPEVNNFVNQIWDEYLSARFPEQAGRGKRPKGPRKQQFKVVLLDLYVAWKEDPDLLIGVSLENGAYKANSRYNKLHISNKLREVLRHLENIGLIGLHLGREGAKRSTRIWATEQLKNIFKEAKINLLMVNDHLDKEVIVLNNKEPNSKGEISKKSKSVEYKDEDYCEIPRMREEIQNYNALLRKSFIDIGGLENPFYLDEYWDPKQSVWKERRVAIGHTNKFVKKVFYRGSWQLGGRLHGGFWQQIGEEVRKKILINDFRTVELDFSGLHINIAYALEGLSPLTTDPYDVKLVFNVPKEEQRELVKSLSSICFNAQNEKKAFRAFRREQPAYSQEKRYKDKELERLLNAFKDKHKSIEKYLCSDKGVFLMNIDGAIASKVVKYFTDMNEPILSVHDSFICREQFKDELTRVMNEVVSETLQGYIVGIKANKIVVDLSSRITNGIINVSKMKDSYFNRTKDEYRSEGYLSRWSEHRYWLHMIENPIYTNT